MSSAKSIALVATPWIRRVQLRAMTRMFARAVKVPAPSLARLDDDGILAAFMRFSAREAERLATDDAARADLRQRAYRMGRLLAALPPFSRVDKRDLVIALYRNIAIGLSGDLPGQVMMEPCVFSAVYSPAACLFMSAFDEGIMAGIVGQGSLAFSCRLTEGAPCCRAVFVAEGGNS